MEEPILTSLPPLQEPIFVLRRFSAKEATPHDVNRFDKR